MASVSADPATGRGEAVVTLGLEEGCGARTLGGIPEKGERRLWLGWVAVGYF